MKKTQILFNLIKGGQLTPKRVLNLAKAYFYYLTKNPRPNCYPVILQVEPTNFCNLHCPLCPTGNNSLKRVKGYMPFGSFKKVMDELGDYLINLTLWNFGEPMLNREIFDMIACAKKKKIFIRMSTNGHFLTPENNKNLVASQLDDLIISLDGASQETLSQYRVGANFATIIDGITALVKEKKLANSRYPFIELQFILMKHNEHEIDQIRKIARTIGVDKLTLKTVSLEMEHTKEELEKMKNYLPGKEEYSRYKSEGKLRAKKVGNNCIRLWLSSVVNWNGDVAPCCYDAEGTFTFGNAFENSFKKVWLNDRYANFRKAILRNKKNIKMCSNCPGTLLGLTLDE